MSHNENNIIDLFKAHSQRQDKQDFDGQDQNYRVYFRIYWQIWGHIQEDYKSLGYNDEEIYHFIHTITHPIFNQLMEEKLGSDEEGLLAYPWEEETER